MAQPLAWPLLFVGGVIQLPKSLTPPSADQPLAQVAFRLCRMMLSRKVLWDEDIGFTCEQFASALVTTPATVRRVLNGLENEGWISRAADGERPILTELGLAALLGRADSALPVQDGAANLAGSAALATAENRLGR